MYKISELVHIRIYYPHTHTTASVSSRSESPDTIPKPNFIKQVLSSPKSRRKKEQQQQKQQQERSKPMQRYSPEDASEDLYTLPDKMPKDTRHGKLEVEVGWTKEKG